MGLFELFYEIGINKEVIIMDEYERQLYCGKFGNVSMRLAKFKVYKVVEENDIIIVYI